MHPRSLDAPSCRNAAPRLSPGPNGTDPKPTHDRHNTRTLSCHLERRPPSYTSLKVKDLALSTHRDTDQRFFLHELLTPWACYGRKQCLTARTTCPTVRPSIGSCMARPTTRGVRAKEKEAGRRPIPVSSRWRGLGALRARAMAGDAGGMGELG